MISLPTSVEPVKATLSTSMMLGDGRAGGFAVTGNDVDHAVGEAGFLGQLADAQRRQRRLLGRLEHDRASRRQRRAPLPRLHQQREIPGDDLPDHADRLMTGVAEIRAVDRDGLAFDLVGPAGIVAVAIDRQRQIGGSAVVDRLAVVQRFQRGQFFEILFDQVGQLVSSARVRGRSSFARAPSQTPGGRP